MLPTASDFKAAIIRESGDRMNRNLVRFIPANKKLFLGYSRQRSSCEGNGDVGFCFQRFQ